MYQALYEDVITYFCEGVFEKEFQLSRKEFSQKVGSILEDHPFFETWIDSNIQRFILDRVLNSFGLTPLQLYYKMHVSEMLETTKTHFKTLLNHQLLVLSYQKKTDQVFVCEDLIKHVPVPLKDLDASLSLSLQKGDWIFARVLDLGQSCQALGAVWHFPREIQSMLKHRFLACDNTWDFIYECMAKKVFSEHYQHIEFEKIFQAQFPHKSMGMRHA